MANYFSLQDGDLIDANVFGLAINNVNNIDAISVSAYNSDEYNTDVYSDNFTGTDTTINAFAIQLNSRAEIPSGTLRLDIASISATGSNSLNTTETYNISSFTSFLGTNNFNSVYSYSWQLLKLTTPIPLASNGNLRYRLTTTAANQLVLGGTRPTPTLSDASGLPITTTATAPLTTIQGYMVFDGGSNSTTTLNGNTNKYFIVGSSTTASLGVTNANLATTFFTVEGFVYFTSSSNGIYITKDGRLDTSWLSWGCQIKGTGLQFNIGSGVAGTGTPNSQYQIYPSPAISMNLNSWQHFAFVRDGVTLSLYLNGNRLTSYNMSTYNSGNFVDGKTKVFIGNVVSSSSDNKLHIGRNFIGANGVNSIGSLTNFRITTGQALYSGDTYTIPLNIKEVNNPYTQILIKGVSPQYNVAMITSDTRSLSTAGFSLDNVHICSLLSATSVVKPINIIANNLTLTNLFIHNKGTLTFPSNSSKTLTINGSNGLQITQDGNLNIGSSTNYIPASTNHTIILNNTQIDVHNGGNLNIYGYPKINYTYLKTDVLSGLNTFTTIDPISSNWSIGDYVIFSPNSSYKTKFDILNLSSFNSNDIFNTTSSGLYTHYGINSIPYNSLIGNLSRNITIRGSSSSNRGTIRVLSAGNLNLNNTLLSNFAINTTNKNGLILSTNNSSNINLSGNAIISDVSNSNYLYFGNNSNLSSFSFCDNILLKGQNGFTLSGISLNTLNIKNNLILSTMGGVAGLQLQSITSNNANITNNYINNCVGFGAFINNSNLTGSFGFFTYNTTSKGILLSSSTLSGSVYALSSIYSGDDGIYIDLSKFNLTNPLTFNNNITQNNTSTGFVLTGNSTIVNLNINNLTSNNNNKFGVEAYNISGSLSSLTINNNLSGGIRTSIGNGSITFDGLSSTTSGTCLNILSAYNYYDTTIKNSYLSSNNICLILDSTRFGKFSIENSTLSSTTPIQLNITRNLLEGSYLFNNNYMGNISFVDLNKYQSNVYKNLGFAFMSHNNLSGNHFSYIPGGTKVRDTVIYDPSTTDNVSERLTPITFNTKLRSSSKFVAIRSGDLTNIRVNVLVVSSYNGNPPRLILKRNPSAGVYSDMVLNSYDMTLGYNDFFELVGTSPYVIDDSILEFYVDCDGTSGYICVDTWYAN